MAAYTEHRSTARVLDALSRISESGKTGYSLTEICQLLDVPKAERFLSCVPRQLYSSELHPRTPNTITDIPHLATQLETFRATDSFYEIKESTPHVRCIAVPMRKNGVVDSDISVALPAFRYTSEKEASIRLLLQNAKHQLEHIFQYADINLINMP